MALFTTDTPAAAANRLLARLLPRIEALRDRVRPRPVAAQAILDRQARA